MTYLFARRYADTIEHLEQTLEIDASFWMIHITLALAHARIGNYEEAVATASQCPDNMETKAALAKIEAVAGNRDRARAILRELMKEQGASPRMRFRMAGIHTEIGEPDAAFECLSKALEGRTAVIVYPAADPSFDNLRDDPRWCNLRRNTLVFCQLELLPRLRPKDILIARITMRNFERITDNLGVISVQKSASGKLH